MCKSHKSNSKEFADNFDRIFSKNHDFTREEYYELHQELWFWCSENPEKNKEDWPKFEESLEDEYDNSYNGVEIESNCFCCVYSEDYHDGDCSDCLVVWPDESEKKVMNCIYKKMQKQNLFSLWNNLGSFHPYLDEIIYMDYERILRRELAYEIANLPMRETKNEQN